MGSRTSLEQSFIVERENGEEDIVDMYQKWIDTSSLDGTSEARGMKSLKLRSESVPVNYVDENTFKHFATDETLKVIGTLD